LKKVEKGLTIVVYHFIKEPLEGFEIVNKRRGRIRNANKCGE